MVLLVLLLQPPQDGNGRLQARLPDFNLLEPPLERHILLNIPVILLRGGSTNAAEATTGQRRLEDVGGVRGAASIACANEHVHHVYEEDQFTAFVLGLLDGLLQALLEHAAQLGPRDHRADIELHHAGPGERVGNHPSSDALGQAFDDGRLADSRGSDERGAVLGPAAEDAHRV